MDYGKFKNNLAQAGISIRELAGLLRMNSNSITNCAKKGKVPAHLGVISRFLVTMTDHQVDYRALLSEIKLEPKKSRGVPFKGLPTKKIGYHLDLTRRPAPKPQRPGDRAVADERPRPRFQYPGDLVIPEESVVASQVVPPAMGTGKMEKSVGVTYRGRKVSEKS
jgi:hypothetical protein